MTTYARFAAAPIGPLLSARDGGLTLTVTGAADINRTARSDVSQSSGTHGIEFALWGEDGLIAVVGLVNASAPLTGYVGSDANGVGWRLHTGEVVAGGVVVASGLPIVGKGDIVGVRVTVGGMLTLYCNGGEVASLASGVAGALHFAVSLAATEAGGLSAAVNAGQWGHNSDAAAAGWTVPEAVVDATRLSDWDFLSATGDSPANARYEGIIADGLSIVSELSFWAWGGGTPVQNVVAECRVLDADGLLDDLALQGVSGVAVAVRQSDSTLAAADAVFRFVIDRIEIENDGSKTIYFRDAHDDLGEPLNRGVFLPNIPALAWRPQPVVIGAVASVPALSANSDGTVLFLADGRVVVDAVMDRGDAMESGTFTLSPDGQQMLMLYPSLGPVVADVSSIASATPATLQQMMVDVFGRLNKSSWQSTDCAAIDTATGYAGVGYFSADSVTGREALAAILPSYAASCWQDADGTLRFARVIAPESYAGTLAFDLDDFSQDLVAVPDDAPNLTRRFAYRLNAQALGVSDIVTDLVDVPQSRRDELTGLWRGQVYAAGTLHPHYRRADAAAPFVSVFWFAADAQEEVDRVVAMYAVQRFFYQVSIRGDQSLAPKPGQIGRITYPRYGLDAGKQVLVRRVERNPVTGDVTLTLWG